MCEPKPYAGTPIQASLVKFSGLSCLSSFSALASKLVFGPRLFENKVARTPFHQGRVLKTVRLISWNPVSPGQGASLITGSCLEPRFSQVI